MRCLAALTACVLAASPAFAEPVKLAGNDGLSGGCTETDYSSKAERLGVLRSSDYGVTWVSLGNACFHWPSTPGTPVGPSPIVINGKIALFFLDSDTLKNPANAPGDRVIYRADSSDGIDFGQPTLVFRRGDYNLTDPSVVRMPGGEYRMYVQSNGLLTASSSDGMAFANTHQVSVPGGTPGALVLPSGVRLFVGGNGIESEDSADGLTFSPPLVQRLPKIGAATADPHPIRLGNGTYLMSYKIAPAPGLPPNEEEVHVTKTPNPDSWAHAPLLTHGSDPAVVELNGAVYLYYVDTKPNRVTVDAGQTKDPISSDVFSQFTEYQGRAIYGGIWAEMLADRKFYLPRNDLGFDHDFHELVGLPEDIASSTHAVTAKVSPWFVSPGTTIAKTATWANRQVPAVMLNGAPHKLIQGDLGIVSGKVYRARVVMAATGTSLSASVKLGWAGGQASCTLSPPTSAFAAQECLLTAGATSDHAWIEIVANGMGTFIVGAVSLMPTDNINGLRADVIALMQDLDASVYRWPGGSDVDSYRYDLALGPRDERPPAQVEAYRDFTLDSRDFGPDEFMYMCSLLGAQAYVALATAKPDLSDQAEITLRDLDEMQFFTTHYPGEVAYWGIGNETFIGYGHDVAAYLVVHNALVGNLRSRFPSSAPFVAVGESGDWSRTMLQSGVDVDLLSEHIYSAAPWGDPYYPIKNVAAVRNDVSNYTLFHRELRKTNPAIHVPLAFDEFNYHWDHRDEVYGEAAPRYCFGDALGIALGLHKLFDNTDLVQMVNTHPVNVLGQIKTTKTAAAMEVTGLVWQLYRQHYGSIPVHVANDVNGLDVVAALSASRNTLTLGVVNASPKSVTFDLAVSNFGSGPLKAPTHHWRIQASSLPTYNEPGVPPAVTIGTMPLPPPGKIEINPYSINVIEIPK